ncbi:guanylate-binding protein 1-like isoform X2 [Oncorhynchus keta]|uniref:guanylate-binding protein 1-like isoform X2 n=1 Tax=Oncorhynchus keta TaxID=8018 RepID=UPI0015F83AF5|nr:guanylate-binding protein 1-like isoform X2 [Oncorhynchus keta]
MAGQTVSMKGPVCLIENDSDGKLCVVRSALETLSQIEQHVVVVAVVGLYRTGKSYLMNKLAGTNKGFALGATIQSQTKGIWMWCVPHPIKSDHTLVLLDTEGLGDVEKGDDSNDNWIFSLAVLLSSTLVYNSMGTIDNYALEKLHYVTELTDLIKVKSVEGDIDESADYVRFFPSFVWAVRDFGLELKLDGKPITAHQYLENALKLKQGTSKKIVQYNLPRDCLRKFFSPRWCFVFERPANSEKMKRMEELTDADLEPSFVKQSRDFCDHLFKEVKTKTMIGGLKVTGKMLGNLTEMYVDMIRSGQVPCLDNAVVALAQIENSSAIEKAKAYYQQSMAKMVVFPTETQQQLSMVHASMEREAVAIFMNSSFKDEDQKYQKELMVQLRNGSYMTPGGYKHYCDDLKMMTSEYRSTGGKGVKAEEVLKEYLNDKESTGQAILSADQSLTEAELKAEEEKAKREASEQEKRTMEEQIRVQEMLMDDQKRTHEEHKKQLLEKMEADKENAKVEYNRVLEAKLKEKEDLLKEGFHWKAQEMEAQIEDLRKEQEEQEKAKPSMWKLALDNIGTAALMILGWGKLIGVGLKVGSRLMN